MYLKQKISKRDAKRKKNDSINQGVLYPFEKLFEFFIFFSKNLLTNAALFDIILEHETEG